MLTEFQSPVATRWANSTLIGSCSANWKRRKCYCLKVSFFVSFSYTFYNYDNAERVDPYLSHFPCPWWVHSLHFQSIQNLISGHSNEPIFFLNRLCIELSRVYDCTCALSILFLLKGSSIKAFPFFLLLYTFFSNLHFGKLFS